MIAPPPWGALGGLLLMSFSLSTGPHCVRCWGLVKGLPTTFGTGGRLMRGDPRILWDPCLLLGSCILRWSYTRDINKNKTLCPLPPPHPPFCTLQWGRELEGLSALGRERLARDRVFL